jgi:hypothetical protein
VKKLKCRLSLLKVEVFIAKNVIEKQGGIKYEE